MQNNHDNYLRVDGKGYPILSHELTSVIGIKPEDRIQFQVSPDGRPTRLAKLYIEPTNQCNLDCRTCMRNVWDEPMGKMSDSVFARIIEGLRAFSPPPSVFFGGFGEPLFHPRIVEMVTQVKALRASVELITNGTMLTTNLSQELIKAGLDVLWVSMDGATPESYADIRLGATLPKVLENLSHFHDVVYDGSDRYDSCDFVPKTRLGIAFVAMKRNIADLPAVMDIGRRFGADRFLVTNVLPYTKEMIEEGLYYWAIHGCNNKYPGLPGMDIDEITYALISQAICKTFGERPEISAQNVRNRCPFVENGVGAINWDGCLSPCLPLLHSHSSYLGYWQYNERISRRWAIGNVMEHNLLNLWKTPEHLAFRERVQKFVFSPCTSCGTCEMSEKNEEDCYGNIFPTCGGCLWAQGVIQCP